MAQMTSEQRFSIIEASLLAAERGDHGEEKRLIKQLPLAPHLAKAAKEIWGKDFLLKEGYDLSEAEVEYGINWLEQ